MCLRFSPRVHVPTLSIHIRPSVRDESHIQRRRQQIYAIQRCMFTGTRMHDARCGDVLSRCRCCCCYCCCCYGTVLLMIESQNNGRHYQDTTVPRHRTKTADTSDCWRIPEWLCARRPQMEASSTIYTIFAKHRYRHTLAINIQGFRD